MGLLDFPNANDPEGYLVQGAGQGEPMNLKNLKNYGLDLLRAGKGLLTGATGIAGDTESLGRGLLSIPSRSPDQSRFGAFLSGLEEPTLLPTSKDINRYIDPLMPQSLQGEAGVPQQIGEFMAPGGLLMKAAEKSAPMVKKGLLSLPTDLPVGASVKPVVNAPVSDIGMYSALEEAGLNLQRNKGPGQAFLNELAKAPNVKSEEIKWIGLDDYLKDKPNATREEVQQFIANNKVDVQEVQLGEPSPEDVRLFMEDEAGKGYDYEDALDYLRGTEEGPKFGSYTLPGGENYREILLTMPAKRLSEDEARKVLGAKPDAKLSDAGISYASRKAVDEYRSSHWDQPNVLAHLRVNDRVDADGKKMLLIEEVQSDWHQAGRDKGYAKNYSESDLQKMLDEAGYQANFNGINWVVNSKSGDPVPNRLTGGSSKSQFAGDLGQVSAMVLGKRELFSKFSVPDAPFKDTWYQLALKRALKYAADNGYERVGLTTGSRQAERYDLSKQVDELLYDKNPDGTYALSAITGSRGNMLGESIPQDKLADYVGKELADKIMKGEGKRTQVQGNREYMQSLSGIDLKVGGEGMKKYYDEVYPKFLDKYGKKWGAKVGETSIDANGKEPVRYIDITPEMKESVKKGQPLFAAVPAVPLASTYQNQGESSTIKQPGANKKQSGLLNSF
jgi:hypothetical protein